MDKCYEEQTYTYTVIGERAKAAKTASGGAVGDGFSDHPRELKHVAKAFGLNQAVWDMEGKRPSQQALRYFTAVVISLGSGSRESFTQREPSRHLAPPRGVAEFE